MITHLHIRNYALIQELDIDFSSGFSGITGETGAGKSILLGAMGLALGERADLKSALDPEKKCVVELSVRLTNYGLKPLFDELELDYADDTILRREILPSGKSRAFVNDTPAKVSDMNQVAQRLIDIHSQNDTLLLRDSQFQLDLVDHFAENKQVKQEFRESLAQWRSASRDLDEIQKELTSGQDMDYQRFLLEELVAARLEDPNEEDVIEEELKRLQHAEEVTESLGAADQVFSMEAGLSDLLDQLRQTLASAAKYDSRVSQLQERVESSQIELDDIRSELEQLASGSDFEPGRLKELDDRMSEFQHLKSKHRATGISELIEIRNQIASQLERFENMEQSIADAEEKVRTAQESLLSKGHALSKSRADVMPKIEAKIQGLLTKLNMPDARIFMELSSKDSPSASGYDEMNWSFSANQGRSPQPLHKVASGGELSRVMLALKAIMSASRSLPTIIFDEIDTGISGETARRVADILKDMGTQMQVFAITHLPQIAAASAQHYKVEKKVVEGRTETNIGQLSQNERVDEISRMISGDSISDAARANAEELLSSE